MLLQSHIVVPSPHTDYYRKLDSERRLITKEEKYYNGFTLVNQPALISPGDLQEGFINLRKNFYSFGSIIRRMCETQPCQDSRVFIWNALYYRPNYQAIPGVDVRKWLLYLRTL